LTEQKNLDFLMGVSLDLSAELGRCAMRANEVLALGTGSIVALDRAAIDPVDLFVNGKLVARGEIVAVDERFGVRITELVLRTSEGT
jgi:flagellar motor switch protein FliN/FliY